MSQVLPKDAQTQSSESFYTALVTNASVLAIELLAFVFLKHRLGRIYAPRVTLPPPDKRAVALPRGWWKWLFAIIAVPSTDVLRKNGMDAYMFLRFLRLLIIIFSSMTILTWAVLLPIDSAGLPNSTPSDDLARLTWGNIPDDAAGRYAAHVAVVYVTTFLALFLIRVELKHYAITRQTFLMSRPHSRLAQARTVLITNVPDDLCNEEELMNWASFVPGGVQNVWIYRDTTDLNDDYKQRLKLCKKLEKATSKLIRHVVKAKAKEVKDEAKEEKKSQKACRNTEKAHRKEVKAEQKERIKEEKALNKARKDGEREAAQAERAYEREHEMVPLDATGVRPSADGTLVGSESGEGYGETKGRAAHDEHAELGRHPVEPTVQLEDAPPFASMRPYRSRTVTSELEAGRLSPSVPSTPELDDPDAVPRTNDTDRNRADALLDKYGPPDKRPHHKLGSMGLWGQKVDTIEWCTNEISHLNKSIDEKRATLATTGHIPRPMGSVFIQCNLQMGAHVLAQCVSHHQPLMMANKYIEVSPKDVIWDNIDDSAYETRFRYITSWMGSLGLILLWFAPVSFVGTLSNVSTLCDKVSWLCWIRNAPTPIPGIIQGILPPLFLAILFAVLPWILRGLAWYENVPRHTLLSLSVYKRYFMFLVIHGFLIITLASALTSTISAIVNNPTETVSELAAKLPSASTFFLTWTLTQGLSGAGSALLQIGQLLMYHVRKWFLGRTPRQAYAVTFMMPKSDFGVVLPRMSLLATIAFAYSVLAPVINALAAISFILFFYSWKFLLTWVFDQPHEFETGGQYFPVAINFLFVGLYIEHICLAALFFLKIKDSVVFVVEAVLMLVLLALTALAQVLFHRSFWPITEFLPMSLATKQMRERWEKQRALRRAQRSQLDENQDLDLFSRQGIKSLLNRRIKAPVQKFADEVHQNVAKTAAIPLQPNDDGHDVSDYNDAEGKGSYASTSAHAVRRPGRNATLHRTSSHRVSRAHAISPAPSDHSADSVVSAAANARREDGEDDDIDKDFDIHGFDHPSTYEEQPWIWLPRDPFGISMILVDELNKKGVGASDEGSVMDRNGTVEVVRGPPNEQWAGGFDA